MSEPTKEYYEELLQRLLDKGYSEEDAWLILERVDE